MATLEASHEALGAIYEAKRSKKVVAWMLLGARGLGGDARGLSWRA